MAFIQGYRKKEIQIQIGSFEVSWRKEILYEGVSRVKKSPGIEQKPRASNHRP